MSKELDLMTVLNGISPEVIARKQAALALLAPRVQYSVPPMSMLRNRTDETVWDSPFTDAADLVLEGLFDRVDKVTRGLPTGIPHILLSQEQWTQRYSEVRIQVPERRRYSGSLKDAFENMVAKAPAKTSAIPATTKVANVTTPATKSASASAVSAAVPATAAAAAAAAVPATPAAAAAVAAAATKRAAAAAAAALPAAALPAAALPAAAVPAKRAAVPAKRAQPAAAAAATVATPGMTSVNASSPVVNPFIEYEPGETMAKKLAKREKKKQSVKSLIDNAPV